MNWLVNALTAFDDGSGSGPALYAGGGITTAGGVGANYLAKWDGQSWYALGSTLSNMVDDLTVFDDGSGPGPALIAGGFFATSPAGDAFIAKWGCDAPTPGFAVTAGGFGGSGAAGLTVIPGWNGERIVPRFVLEPKDAFRRGLLLLSEPAAALSLGQFRAAAAGVLASETSLWVTLPLPDAEGLSLPTEARRYLFGREVQVQAIYTTGGSEAAFETSNALRMRVER